MNEAKVIADHEMPKQLKPKLDSAIEKVTKMTFTQCLSVAS
ncbi:hypothetical protein [Candidatus Pseudomonas adelgestsugas]